MFEPVGSETVPIRKRFISHPVEQPSLPPASNRSATTPGPGVKQIPAAAVIINSEPIDTSEAARPPANVPPPQQRATSTHTPQTTAAPASATASENSSSLPLPSQNGSAYDNRKETIGSLYQHTAAMLMGSAVVLAAVVIIFRRTVAARRKREKLKSIEAPSPPPPGNNNNGYHGNAAVEV